jgi:hypothetical protein
MDQNSVCWRNFMSQRSCCQGYLAGLRKLNLSKEVLCSFGIGAKACSQIGLQKHNASQSAPKDRVVETSNY